MSVKRGHSNAWLQAAAELQAVHAGRRVISSDDLTLALAEIWRLLEDAPTDLLVAYREIDEGRLRAASSPLHNALSDGLLLWSITGDWGTTALSIGAQLWALDGELASRPRFARAPASALSFLCEAADVYVIPRIHPKPTNRRIGPGNGFGRRGTPHHRILPRQIDDKYEIQLHWNPHLAFGSTAGNHRQLGAALLPGLNIDWMEAESGLVAREAPCEREAEVLRSQVRSAFSESLLGAAWPELSMPPSRLQLLQAELQKEADTALPLRGPVFVAAGSWHEREGEVVRNVMRVLDKSGVERLRFEKLTTFVSGDLREGNEPSAVIPVLLNQDALVTFAICSDFCDLEIDVPYLELDVDLIVVISHGNRSAMNGHERNAGELAVRLGASTFVVQHHDEPGAPLGWVFPSDAQHPSLDEDRPWSVREISFR